MHSKTMHFNFLFVDEEILVVVKGEKDKKFGKHMKNLREIKRVIEKE